MTDDINKPDQNEQEDSPAKKSVQSDSASNSTAVKREKPVEKPAATIREEKVDTAENQSAPSVVQERVVHKSGGKGLSIFAILLSLAALGGSGYTWYQTKVLDVQKELGLTVGVNEIGAQVARFGDAISRLQQDQADVVSDSELENRLLQASTETDKAIRVIAEEQQSVQDSVRQLSAELQRGVDQFTIEEVSQLLRLANNSVLFGEDIDSAINALELADGQLKSLKDPSFTAVRSQINAELTALRSVNLPDLEAISGQLTTLKKNVKSMPLANEPDERSVDNAVSATAEEELTWRSELVKIWRDLVGSISIQRVDQPPKPLLVPEQRYFLNENIGLAISKAELALLQGQEKVFQQSLAEASQWLSDYFDMSNADVTDTVEQLNRLQNLSISTEIPNITGSYQALQTIVGGQ